MVRLWKTLLKLIGAVCRHAGVGWVVSSTNVVVVDGTLLTSESAFEPSPDVMIFPGRYIAALPPFTGFGSIVVHVCVSTRRPG